MRIVVLGDAEDVRGFALIGLPGEVCQDARRAEAQLGRLATAGTDVGLVLVSPRLARLAARTIERLRASTAGPAVVVLPETDTSPTSKVQSPKSA